MDKKDIIRMYREWRKANGNRKPNRVIVKMHWEDDDNTEKGYQVDTIGIESWQNWTKQDDAYILWYCRSLKGLLALTEPDNGSDFIVTEVLEFYKR